MAETIEKITRTDPPLQKKYGNGISVTDKIQLSRARFRFLLAILILGVYSVTIYFLFVHEGEMNDKISSLMQVMVGALTVILSQLGAFYFGDSSSDMAKTPEDEKGPTQFEQRVDITAPNQVKEE
tara:strand:- start:1977 stop:2351 length:375 start_codon:yes stop_codon:yes gene_type:complete